MARAYSEDLRIGVIRSVEEDGESARMRGASLWHQRVVRGQMGGTVQTGRFGCRKEDRPAARIEGGGPPGVSDRADEGSGYDP